MGGHHPPSGQRKCSYEFHRRCKSGGVSSFLDIRPGRGEARTLDGCCGGLADKDDLVFLSRSLRSLDLRRRLSRLTFDEYSSTREDINGTSAALIISTLGIHLKSLSQRVVLSTRLLGVNVRKSQSPAPVSYSCSSESSSVVELSESDDSALAGIPRGSFQPEHFTVVSSALSESPPVTIHKFNITLVEQLHERRDLQTYPLVSTCRSAQLGGRTPPPYAPRPHQRVP